MPKKHTVDYPKSPSSQKKLSTSKMTTTQHKKIKIHPVFIFMGIILFSFSTTIAQTSTRNFVRETVYKKNGGSLSNPTETQSTITYLDGLGRPVQTVAVHQGGGGEDIVSHISYDEFGRDNLKYAPYPSQKGNNGAFRSAAPTEAAGALGDVKPYSLSVYEPSPLNRMLKQGGPGDSWGVTDNPAQLGDHSVKLKYSTNGANEVKRFDATNSDGTGGTAGSINGGLLFQGYYGINQLWVTETLDENNINQKDGNRTKEYKDKSGRVVMKRAYVSDAIIHDTYYIYDDFGQLRAVFPPLLSPTLINDGVAFTTTELNNIEELAFLYAYDTEGRMTGKKVPGAKKVSMTYDAQDRLTSTTDGKGQTINLTYDALNRVIQTAVGTEWLTKTYYDGTNPDWANTAGSDYPVDLTAKVGLVTGGETRRIDENNTYGDPIVSRIYYDSRYRPVKTYKNYGNLVSGGIVEEVMTKRSYIGTTLEEKTIQSNGMDNFTILKTYQYDHAERLLSICHRITEKSGMKTREEVPHLLNWLTYDGLGRLQRKSVGKLPLKYLKKEPNYEFAETQYFDYNIRNSLTQSKGYRLLNKNSYGTPEVGKQNFKIDLSYTADGQYNGNIGKYTWEVNGDAGGFNLVYDGINRLLSAKDAGAYWDEELAYDKNGNITNLKRWRKAATPELIDDLSYTYAKNGISNQLLSVSDATNKDVGYNNTNSGTDFAYDDNGNLTQDNDKGIGVNGIEYNVLNLVRKVTGSGNIGQKYTWDASGMKLAYEAGNVKKRYLGAIEYANNTNNVLAPNRIQTEEGHILLRENWVESSPLSKYVYYYTLSDHLGNARLVMNDDQDAEVVQSNSYSAFGLLALGPDGTASKFNNRFYNGKEKQEGTGWLDYGARMYSPEMGRWMSVDPKSEKYVNLSPYNFTGNNPVKFIDKDGKDFDYSITTDKKGNKTINVKATVFVYGKEATAGLIKGMNEGFAKLSKGGTYTDKDGNKYSVKISVNYIASASEDKARESANNTKGGNILEFNSKLTTKQMGEYQLLDGSKGSTTLNENTAGVVYNNQVGKINQPSFQTAFHETGHFLGLGERYKVLGGFAGVSDEGFRDDIMGVNSPNGIHSVHYQNIGDAVKSTGQTKGVFQGGVIEKDKEK
jgi:RHS repeat-associated protein